MPRRIFAVTVSKAQVGALLAVAVLGVPGFARRARAANVYVADTQLTLTEPGAFVGAALPEAGVDTVVFGGSLSGAINASYIWSIGAAGSDASWGGINVLGPGGDITITDAANMLGLSGGGIEMAAAARNLTLNAGIYLGADQTWNVGAERTLTVNGTVGGAAVLTIAGGGHTVISGRLLSSAAVLNKFGVGTLTLSSQNTYTGFTNVGSKDNSAGTLILDFSGAEAPASNIVHSSSSLYVRNAEIRLVGNANFAVSQTFNGMSASWGLTTLSCTSSGMGVTVNLGTITRSYNQGLSVRIIPNANPTLSTFMATSGAAGVNNGLVEKNNISSTASNAGPYMTYGLSDFAGVVSGVIGATTYVSKGDGSAITSTANGTVYDILNGASGTVTSGAFNVEGLRFTGAGAKTFRLTGGSMVLGAVLVTPEVGTDTVTISSAGGSVRTQDNSDLVIWQNNTGGDLIFSAPLARRTTSSGYGSLVKNGAGTLVLTTTSNSLNGDMFINEGPVRINAASALSTTANTQIVLEGGGLVVNGTFANANGSARHPIRVAGNGGTIEVMGGNTFTITYPASSAIYGSSLLTKTGAGTLALGDAASTWSGGLAIADGLVDVQATAGTPLGSGPVSVNGGTLGISGMFMGSNTIAVHDGGAMTVTGTLTSAFTVHSGGIYLVSSGTVSGAITLLSGATVTGAGDTAAPLELPSGVVIEPGSRQSVATMNFQDLTLRSGSILNLTLQGNTHNADLVGILPGGTLNLASNVVVNLFDAASGLPYFSNGTYSLFSGVDVVSAGQYVGGSATYGTLTNFVAGNFNPEGVRSVAATFSIIGPATASSIIVTISGVVMSSAWAGAGGVWTDAANWTMGIPGSSAGDQACLVGKCVPAVVDLGAAQPHLSALSMDSGTHNGSWTVICTGGGKVLMDSGTNPAFIQVGSGAQCISAAIDLLSPTTFQFNSSGGALTVSGIIDTPTACPVTMSGANPGVLVFTAENTISGPIHIVRGTLQIGAGGTTGSLGTGAVLNDAALVFNRTDTHAVPNAITGSGTLIQMGSGTTILTASADYIGPTVMSAGQLSFGGTGVTHNIAGVSGTGSLAVAAGTILTSDGVYMPMGSLTIAGTQTIRSNATTSIAYPISNATTPLAGTSKVSSLIFNSTASGQLDLTDNGLIIESANTTSKLALLPTIVANSRQISNATQSFFNITSSTAINSAANYTLAVADVADLPGRTYFGGLPVTVNSIVVTEAIQGDANLDGTVNFVDYQIWLKSNTKTTSSYARGDFNGDGKVNFVDYQIWLKHNTKNIGSLPIPFDAGTGTLGTGGGLGGGGQAGSGLGGAVSAVPEPASLAVLALGATGLLRRRRGTPRIRGAGT